MASPNTIIDNLPVSIKVFLVAAVSFIAFAGCFGGALIVIDQVETNRMQGYEKVFERQQHLKDLYNYLGFDSRQGGLVHNFKNYLLRGERWSSRAGDEQAYNNLGKLTATMNLILDRIESYRRLPGVTDEERAALADIESVVSAYRAQLPTLVEMKNDGISVTEIDAAVKVSDEPAARGLDVLSAHARDFRTATMQASAATVASAVNGFILLMIAAGALTGVVVIWVVLRLMRGLHTLSDGVYRLAQGDLTVKLDSASRDEVGIISRFVDDLSRSMHHVVSQIFDAAGMMRTEAEAMESGDRKPEVGAPRMRLLAERVSDLVSDFVFLKKDGTAKTVAVQEAKAMMTEEVISEEELARAVALSGGRGPSCSVRHLTDVPVNGED